MEEEFERDMKPKLIGETYMKYPTEKSNKRARFSLYQCQHCGKEFEARTTRVKCGHTKSCGCLSRQGHIKHGLSGHRLYQTWNSIIKRCFNKKSKTYKNYGAMGITVCTRWRDIGNFIEDMYPTFKEGLSLDRINVGGDYTPDNCRWATNETQHRNTRKIYRNNTSGFRGVHWQSKNKNWRAMIRVSYTKVHLGVFQTALEAGKAYERYIRINNLEHNFIKALTEEELEELYKQKESL